MLTFFLSVINGGPSNSATTRVVDTLPPGFLATDVESTIPGSSCSIAFGGETVTCTFALGAANQCSATPIPTSGLISISAVVRPETNAGVYTNTAVIEVVGDCGYDPSPGNNTSTAEVQVIGAAGAPALSQAALAALAILLAIGGAVMLRRRRAN